jgi:hypothetical protein
MASYAKYRDIHLWTGLILLIPISVIATTGFLWNHEKSLGIKQTIKPKAQAGHANPKQLKSAASTESPLRLHSGLWQEQAATMDAAILVARETWGADVAIERIELKHEQELGLIVKMKVPENANLSPEEIVWSPDYGIVETKGEKKGKGVKAETDWAKLVHDLHTGKFFSKNWGFLWSDSGALAIVCLSLTGVVLYVLPFLKKRHNRKKRDALTTDRNVTAERSLPLARGAEANPSVEVISC